MIREMSLSCNGLEMKTTDASVTAAPDDAVDDDDEQQEDNYDDIKCK